MKMLFVCFPVVVYLFFAGCLQAQDPVVVPPTVPPPLPPQTLKSELMDYTVVTFGPRAVFSPGFSMFRRLFFLPKDYPDNWHEGIAGMARNYGNAFVSRTSLETGRYLSAAVLHEDFRYRPSTSKNSLARGWHALAFTFVDKSSSGGSRFAAANFIGAGASGFVGMAYLPNRYGNLNNAEIRTSTAFAGFIAQNLLKEFHPEINQLKRKLHLPFATDPVPKWWVKRN